MGSKLDPQKGSTCCASVILGKTKTFAWIIKYKKIAQNYLITYWHCIFIISGNNVIITNRQGQKEGKRLFLAQGDMFSLFYLGLTFL